MFMENVFSLLAFLLLVQSFAALVAGLRFARYSWQALSNARDRYVPKTAVIIPCKGLEHDFEENIVAYLAQDYRQYELIFVTENEADPAYHVIKKILAESNRSAWLITAGEAKNRGQKVHNLCAAIAMLDAVDRKTEVLVFADSDARPAANWLCDLVSPLSDPRVGAATGFRWYVPVKGGFWSHLLSVWNAGTVNLFGERSAFTWGGATAINRDTFEALRIRQQWEEGAVSDDYVLTRAVQAEGLRIKFVPQCLVMSEAKFNFSELLEFTTRQMIITRVYVPRVWWLAAITHSLFNFTLWGGLGAWALGKVSGELLLPLLLTSLFLGVITGGVRGFMAAQLLSDEYSYQVKKGIWAYCLLNPLVSLLYLYNLIASAKTRRIVWRGIGYEMISPKETVIWQRPEALSASDTSEMQRKHSEAAAGSSSSRDA